MGRIFKILLGLLGLVVVVYLGDWVGWRVRGMDQVEVTRVVTASLKGNKEAYYTDGTDTVACSRSMAPQPGSEGFTTPCWWLRRHREVVEKE